MTGRLVTADDVALAVEAVLVENLPGFATQAGLVLGPVTTWEQVPTLPALTSAIVPVGAISSPGLTAPPTRRGDGSWDATWRITVGVWDRDTSFRATAARARRWGALVRAVVLCHPDLGGLASRVGWVSEDYDEIPNQGAARTLGGCVVGFDVFVEDVLDPFSFTPAAGPVVQSTYPSLIVREAQE